MIIRNYLKKICANIRFEDISTYSAKCSYYTILSFIPFIILLITLIQFTNIDQENLYMVISKFIPSTMNEIILDIIKEIYSKSIGTISISIIFTIWSAGKGLLSLMKGLHSIYEIKDEKNNSFIYFKIKSIIQTILLLIFIVFGLIILIFGNTLILIIQKHIILLEYFNFIIRIFINIGSIFLTFLIFLFIYKFIPKHKVSFKSQVPGAIFGSIGLNIILFVFSQYLNIFKGFSITYGSLTMLILILIWIYACFYTIFLGAEINKKIMENFK